MLVRELPYVGRLTAPNPSLMTGKGTNTYIFGTGDLAILDPGPDDDAHIDAILAGIAEMGGTPVLILVTHSHLDHLPGAFSLQRRLNVPIAAYAPILGVDIGLRHDQRLTIGGHPVRALHTPGHGPAITDPRARIEEYIAHRHDRERQILDAIRGGAATIDAMVGEIYADVDPRLHPVAAQSVDAHLRKLVREGRIGTYLEEGKTHYEMQNEE